MKTTETTQFEQLCEKIRNMHGYYDALTSLKNSSHFLSEQLDSTISIYKHSNIRVSDAIMLVSIAKVELNIALVKQRYINDIMEEYEKILQNLAERAYQEYNIKDE